MGNVVGLKPPAVGMRASFVGPGRISNLQIGSNKIIGETLCGIKHKQKIIIIPQNSCNDLRIVKL